MAFCQRQEVIGQCAIRRGLDPLGASGVVVVRDDDRPEVAFGDIDVTLMVAAINMGFVPRPLVLRPRAVDPPEGA